MVKVSSDDNLEFDLNPDRLNYLLDLYKLPKEEFVGQINKGQKKEILTLEKLNNLLDRKEKIKAYLLKKFDKIFNQGITWYISDRALPDRKSGSIFFRKETFNAQLNTQSIKKVKEYEELKFEIQTLCKYIEFDSKKFVRSYDLSDNPVTVATEMRALFDKNEQKLIESKLIKKAKTEIGYLKNMVKLIENLNIFVFEFIENWNQKERVNFDGFFISPSIIVIKRQKYYRREIFTLLHEFAHCLLDLEEIDGNVEEGSTLNSNDIENWCHTFTYYFLLSPYKDKFEGLRIASLDNNFHEAILAELYNNTFLSRSALYTRLRIENKISSADYIRKMSELKAFMKQTESETKAVREKEKQQAKELGEVKEKFVPAQKPIDSNLFKEILRINYFQGNIDEGRLREDLRLKANKNIEEVLY